MPPDLELLRLMESHNQIGIWIWCFEHDDQYWSPGCLRLLGHVTGSEPMSYSFLLGLVHPDDRILMPEPEELLQGEPSPVQTIRVIRPDGSVRIVASRIEMRVSTSGRVEAAWGTLLDVTERERLIRAREMTIRRGRTLDRCAQTLRFSMGPDMRFDFDPNAAEVVGRPLSEINADPFALFAPDQRGEIRHVIAQHRHSQGNLIQDVRMGWPTPEPRVGRLVMVPVHDDGETGVSAWSGLLLIRERAEAESKTSTMRAVERSCTGRHFRAARALLDWSMQDLANAAQKSLSTVRRIEQDEGGNTTTSRSKLLAALRRAGVRFLIEADGAISISRDPDSDKPSSDRAGTRHDRDTLSI